MAGDRLGGSGRPLDETMPPSPVSGRASAASGGDPGSLPGCPLLPAKGHRPGLSRSAHPPSGLKTYFSKSEKIV
ncbi:MAG: hypothetical protein DMH00_00795 [Acidobacteria bacterium]|nr:MAG: hypothetical protein DMH00_00795 [Acidobacteriota bacterium]